MRVFATFRAARASSMTWLGRSGERARYSIPKKPVVISQPCHKLLMPGDTALHGFLGDRASFEAHGGRACDACPYDGTYRGLTNRDDKSNWVRADATFANSPLQYPKHV